MRPEYAMWTGHHKATSSERSLHLFRKAREFVSSLGHRAGEETVPNLGHGKRVAHPLFELLRELIDLRKLAEASGNL